MDAGYKIGVDVPRTPKEKTELLELYFQESFDKTVAFLKACNFITDVGRGQLLTNRTTIKGKCMEILSARSASHGSVFDADNVFTQILNHSDIIGHADFKAEALTTFIDSMMAMKFSRLSNELAGTHASAVSSVIMQSDSFIDAINYDVLYRFYSSEVGRKCLEEHVECEWKGRIDKNGKFTMSPLPKEE